MATDDDHVPSDDEDEGQPYRRWDFLRDLRKVIRPLGQEADDEQPTPGE